MSRLTNKDRELLLEARRAAGLERASFDDIIAGTGCKVVLVKDGKMIYDTGLTVTEFIRDKVRIHHQSWIIGPINQVLGEDD